MDNLSTDAQAILAGFWGLVPGFTLTLRNVESRLSERAGKAMQELIDAGLIHAEEQPPVAKSAPVTVVYSLTEQGKTKDLRKSFKWMEQHGSFSIVEPIE